MVSRKAGVTGSSSSQKHRALPWGPCAACQGQRKNRSADQGKGTTRRRTSLHASQVQIDMGCVVGPNIQSKSRKMFPLRGQDEGDRGGHRPRLDPSLPRRRRPTGGNADTRSGQGTSANRAGFRILTQISLGSTNRESMRSYIQQSISYTLEVFLPQSRIFLYPTRRQNVPPKSSIELDISQLSVVRTKI